MVLIIGASCTNNKPKIVAWVSDESITKSELKHWMLLEKASVYSYFYRKYGVSDSDSFWIQKLGDEIPLEKLKSISIEKAKRIKIQQILALEKGIIETANYDEIIDGLENINVERKQKVENGEPIYGPIQFTKRTWFFHVFDKMVIELKDELAKNELKPDCQQLLMMQKGKGQSSNDISGFLTMQYVDENYDIYIDKLMSKTDIKINRDIYKMVSMK